MTRKTLFRHVLALKLLSAGYYGAYFFALPSRSKDWFSHERRNRWIISKLFLDVLADKLKLASGFAYAGAKIGDTISVRKPNRYMVRH